MAAGAAAMAQVDKFVTVVSLAGVNNVMRGQQIMSAGYKALSGDIKGAAASMQQMKIGAGHYMAAGAAIGATGISLSRSIYQATLSIDSLKQGLIAVSGSEEEAEKQLRRLKELAKMPGLGFEQVIQGSVNLQAAGLSAQVAEDAMLGFGNALATVGRGKEDLDGVNRALGQIMSKGKVSAEEINQLAERVPQIRMIMKEAFGTANTEELQKMGIDSEEFITKVVAALKKLPPAASSLQAEVDNLSDSWTQLMYGGGSSRGGLIGTVKIANGVLGIMNKLNDATGGLAVVSVAAGATILGGILVVAPGIKALRDMWLEVASAANQATTSQVAASTAGSGAGVSAGAGKLGKLGGLGGMLGKGAKGIGGGLILGLAGMLVGGWGDSEVEKYRESQGKESRGGAAIGTIGGGALSGAGIGAALGSVVPGVGTVLGGAAGALVGTGIAAYKLNGAFNEVDAQKDKSPNSPQNKQVNLLTELVKLTAEQTRVIVGNSSRASSSINSGDMQRAWYGIISKGMV